MWRPCLLRLCRYSSLKGGRCFFQDHPFEPTCDFGDQNVGNSLLGTVEETAPLSWYWVSARPICRRLFWHSALAAALLAICTADRMSPINTDMIATTTINSTSE